MKENISIRRDPKGRMHDEAIITINYTPNWFESLLGFKPYTHEYFGSCTCWYRITDGAACNVFQETRFLGIWTKWRRDNC